MRYIILFIFLYFLKNKVPLPKHITDTILFLASDESSYMTGEIINLDAGYSLNHNYTFIDNY